MLPLIVLHLRFFLTHPPPLGRSALATLGSSKNGRGGFYMQLCTPRLVAIAVSIAASVCKINFHVSFFIAFLL